MGDSFRVSFTHKPVGVGVKRKAQGYFDGGVQILTLSPVGKSAGTGIVT